MRRLIAVISFLAFWCIGCQTLRVRRTIVPVTPSAVQNAGTGPQTAAKASEERQLEKTEGVPGLPFYVKKAACLHSTVWLEPVYTLTLELVSTPLDDPSKARSTLLGSTVLSLKQLGAAQDLFHSVNEPSEDLDKILSVWKCIATQDGTPYTPIGFPEQKNRILISNTAEPQVYVDYSQHYYLNAHQPLAGSAKVDSKLASDGTLTEASAEVENKTLETLVSGVKELTGTAVGVGAKRFIEAGREQHVKLTILAGGFKHTFSQLAVPSSFPCQASSEMTSAQSYSRTEITTGGGKVTESKGSKITVSGEITLPESKPTSAPGAGKASESSSGGTTAAPPRNNPK
ncbi:MAG: hypothetical protein JOY62_16555 [Acidobacteriaceae bacterium]|nr:hypothetical protein [Acidobacteriaceae bacterium]MBV9781576.1 hypothetical protein [Acidobacteriaceae bacterium]